MSSERNEKVVKSCFILPDIFAAACVEYDVLQERYARNEIWNF